MAKGGSRVEEERDKTSRGSHMLYNRGTIGSLGLGNAASNTCAPSLHILAPTLTYPAHPRLAQEEAL